MTVLKNSNPTLSCQPASYQTVRPAFIPPCPPVRPSTVNVIIKNNVTGGTGSDGSTSSAQQQLIDQTQTANITKNAQSIGAISGDLNELSSQFAGKELSSFTDYSDVVTETEIEARIEASPYLSTVVSDLTSQNNNVNSISSQLNQLSSQFENKPLSSFSDFNTIITENKLDDHIKNSETLSTFINNALSASYGTPEDDVDFSDIYLKITELNSNL